MLAALLAAWIHFSRYASAAGNGTLFPRSLDAPGYGQLLGMVLPLTANRIVLNLLQSVESVSIPAGCAAMAMTMPLPSACTACSRAWPSP